MTVNRALLEVRGVRRDVDELKDEVAHLRELLEDATLTPVEAREMTRTIQRIKRGDTRGFHPLR